MRRLVLNIVMGLGAGIAGAFLFNTYVAVPRKQAGAVAFDETDPAVTELQRRNAVMAARMAALESRLGATSATEAGVQAPEARAFDPAARNTEIAAQQEQELAFQERALIEHDAEPRDRAWAAERASEISKALTASLENSAGLGGRYLDMSVDCRSKTCVAKVGYTDAGVAFQQRQALVVGAPSCRGMTSAMLPESDPGEPYEVVAIYYCD